MPGPPLRLKPDPPLRNYRGNITMFTIRHADFGMISMLYPSFGYLFEFITKLGFLTMPLNL